MPNSEAVQSMFSSIAGRYDLANHLISGGIDFYWRHKLAKTVKAYEPNHIVDLATGSGDVAFTLAKTLSAKTQIVGLDFCNNMLLKAQQKNKYPSRVSFSYGDCLDLPLSDASTDAITISFGLRNLEHRHQGLSEMNRILKPQGHLFILEFSQPDKWINPLYYFYLNNILPKLAYFTTGNKNAYQYLANSIEKFPTRENLSSELYRAGFQHVTSIPLTFGVVALHHARCY